MRSVSVGESEQLSFDDLANVEPEPTPAAPAVRRADDRRWVPAERFARRMDNRLAQLCRDLPPSAEPVLRSVIAAMAGGRSCRFSYVAIADASSVSLGSVKRMIPLLRREGLLNAFDRAGNYVAPSEPGTRGRNGPKAMLTLRLGPMIELAQPDLETPSDQILELESGRKLRPQLVANCDQSGRKPRPAPPPPEKRISRPAVRRRV